MESLGERIRARREHLGWTQAKLADLLNIKIGTLSGYERNYRQPDARMLQLLSINLKVTSDYLLGLPEHKDTNKKQNVERIPVLGQIRTDIPLLNPDNYAGKLDVPCDIGADFAVQAVGDSMIGVGILDGDYAICRQTPTAHAGQIVAALHNVAIGLSKATLKYFFIEDDNLILRAANPDYDDITMEGNYWIAGIMVALCRRDAPLYRVFTDYISVRDYNLEKWNEVIQIGLHYGITPEQVKELLTMQWEMAQRLAKKRVLGSGY